MLPYIAVEDKTVFAIHLRFLVLKIHLADWDSQLPGNRCNSGEAVFASSSLDMVKGRHLLLCGLRIIARQKVTAVSTGAVQNGLALLTRLHDLTAQSARGGL